MKSTAWYAEKYQKDFGMMIVPLREKQKLPISNDWGINTLQTPESARSYYEEHPTNNIGLALGPSKFCSLDIDCLESFRVICDEFGMSLDELVKTTPTIQGASKGMRIMFRVPDGVTLPYAKLNWKRNDETNKSYTVFELRSAMDGHQRFDVLPPSIHPDTLKPYKWLTQPNKNWPTPPEWLLAIWTSFERFKPQMQAMCPWAAPIPTPTHVKQTSSATHTGSVIESYIQATDIETELLTYGYKRIGKRFLSPHSTTNLPGVIIFPDDKSCWIHHSSDPLCSEDTGKPVNSFDLFCHYSHGGDASKAVKAAAEMLGIKHIAVQTNAPSTQVSSAPVAVATNGIQWDIHSPLIHTTGKQQKPIKHIDNLREILKRMNVTVRYNMISKEEEILIPLQSFSIDNQANASLAWLKSECSLVDFNTDSLDGMVTYLADQNQYNPVAEWVNSKPWDGKSRVKHWYNTVTGAHDDNATDLQFKETLMRRWAISAIAAAFSPNGISAAGVLTLQGEQYVGKTKWFKSLAPSDMGVIKDGMILRPDDKDSVKQCVSFWLVELGELDATFRKSDIAALKSFLTNDSDVLRRAYARKESKYARRTVFFASVNPKEFLHDPTGNRRYWTIEAVKLDHSHNLDMQQIWAEFYEMWKQGESYYLTADEMKKLNEHNSGYTATDPIEDRVMTRLDWEAEHYNWRWATATDILIDVGMEKQTRGDAITCGQIIRKNNGNQGKRSNGKTLLYCPPKIVKYY